MHLANIFFCFKPGYHDLMTASHTFESKIRTGSQNQPALFSAGMLFLHYQNVVELNIHIYLPLIPSQYCFAACSNLLFPKE